MPRSERSCALLGPLALEPVESAFRVRNPPVWVFALNGKPVTLHSSAAIPAQPPLL